MARAAATRCRWPPDIWLGNLPSTSSTPSLRATFSTLGSTFDARSPLMVSAKAIFSKPVSVSSRFASWNTKPSWSRRKSESLRPLRSEMSLPFSRIWPVVGVSMVAMQLSSVVFPDPLGPMMPTNSPRSTEKLRPSKAVVTDPLPPYSFPKIAHLQQFIRTIPCKGRGCGNFCHDGLLSIFQPPLRYGSKAGRTIDCPYRKLTFSQGTSTQAPTGTAISIRETGNRVGGNHGERRERGAYRPLLRRRCVCRCPFCGT